MTHLGPSPINCLASTQQETIKNLARLSASIDQVITQLDQKYTFDRVAIRAKTALMALKKQLDSNNQAITSPRIPPEINEFMTLGREDEGRDSLTYPFYTAFTQAFPRNRKKDGHWVAFREFSDHTKGLQTPITKFKDEIIPTIGNLLHFAQFVIEQDGFGWQDKISAVYRELKRGRTFHQGIQLTDDLFLVGQKETLPEGNDFHYLSQSLIAYYYYMIHQGATKQHLLFWNQELLKDQALSSLIATLCEYKLLLQETSYCVDDISADTDQTLNALLKTIKADPLSSQYLSSGEETVGAFNAEVARILSNLSSPAIYQGSFSLQAALTVTSEAYTQLQDRFKKQAIEYSKSNPLFFQYQKLIATQSFETLLAYTQQTDVTCFYTLCTLPEHEAQAIIQYLNTPAVIGILNKAIALLNDSSENTVQPEKIFNASMLEELVKAIHQSHYTLSSELSELIEQYNQEDPGDPITLTHREKNKLQRLDSFNQEFDTILQENHFALNTLTQHGCSTLIEALQNHGELADQLKQKRFKDVMVLAENYCKNARENIILHAIDSGLNPSEALSLDGTSRKNWISWRNGLHDIIKTTYGGVGESAENCDRYIAQRIPALLLQYNTIDQSIEEAMQDDKQYFDTLIFAGFFQCKVLSLEEIFSLSAENTYYFYRISTRLSKHHERIVREANCNNPVEIIASTTASQEKRAELDALKEKANANKQDRPAYIHAFNEYIDYLLVHSRIIGINLHSIYASFVDELAKIGINGVSLQQTLSVPQAELAQLKKDREEGRAFFNPQLRLFKQAKITIFSELLEAIVAEDPTIDMTQVYRQGLNVTKLYSQSKTIEEYHKAGLLEARQIFTLTPDILNALREKSRYFLSIRGNHFKTAFKAVIDRKIAMKTADIEEDFHKILPYFRLRLLSKIVESQRVSTTALIHAAFKDNNYSSQLEASWNTRLTTVDSQIQPIIQRLLISQYHNSRSELLASVYQLDPSPHPENFSFDHLIQSMDGYLDNLGNPSCQKLLKAGLDPVSAMHLTQENIRTFSLCYENLQSFLTRKALDSCIKQFLTSGRSISELFAVLETTYTTLEHSVVTDLLHQFNQDLSDDAKQAVYQTFAQLIMTHDKEPKLVAEATQKLSFDIVKPLLQSEKFTLNEILSNSLAHFEQLENALDDAEHHAGIMQLLEEPCLYANLEQLLVESCSRRTASDRIISSMSGQLDRLMHDEPLRRLVRAGVTIKNALNMAPTLLDRANEIILTANQQLEHCSDPAIKDLFQARVDQLVEGINHPSSRTRHRRHSQESSRRVSKDSYAAQPSYETRPLHSRESRRSEDKRATQNYKTPKRGGFFSRLNKLADKPSHSGKNRPYGS